MCIVGHAVLASNECEPQSIGHTTRGEKGMEGKLRINAVAGGAWGPKGKQLTEKGEV